MPTAHTVLVHDPTLDLEGPRLERAAVRGILRRGPDLLLLRSIEGDYGFPGGGLHPGESAEGALMRELLEETGLPEVTVGDELLSIVEHRPAREPELAVFTMINRYFTCQSDQEPGEQQLEDYEVELGLAPVWVRPDLALRANEVRCADRMVPCWVVRDTLALRMMVVGEV